MIRVRARLQIISRCQPAPLGSSSAEVVQISTTRTGSRQFCTAFAPCYGSKQGLRLGLRGVMRRNPATALYLRHSRPAKSMLRKAVCAFHRQSQPFHSGVRGMRTKYKILWFAVDLYHRQRYFFICGCKRTTTKDGGMAPSPTAGRRTNPADFLKPRFPRVVEMSGSHFPARLALEGGRVFTDFAD